LKGWLEWEEIVGGFCLLVFFPFFTYRRLDGMSGKSRAIHRRRLARFRKFEDMKREWREGNPWFGLDLLLFLFTVPLGD